MPAHDSEPQMVALTAEPAGERRARRREVEVEYVLRPRSAPQIVDLGMDVLLHRFLACLGIGIVLWFPLRTVMPYFTRVLAGDSGAELTLWTFFGWFGVVFVAQELIEVLLTTAVTLISYEQLLGRSFSPLEALRRVFRRIWALIGLFVIRLLILMLGGGLLLGLSMLCPPFLLGAGAYYFFFSWKLSVVPSALILENVGVSQALARSFQLTQGSFFRWLGVWLLSWMFTLSFSIGTQVGDSPELREAMVHSVGIPGLFYDACIVMLSSLLAGITTAILAIGVTAYYLDTRIRREGFDLVMRLERSRRSSSAIEGLAG